MKSICVILIMSDIKATVNGEKLDDLHLNTWTQFGIDVRKRIKDRITFLQRISFAQADAWAGVLCLMSKFQFKHFLSFLITINETPISIKMTPNIILKVKFS